MEAAISNKAPTLVVTGRLAGRRTVIFGAASGIGRGVLEAYLREGAEVVAFDLSVEKTSELRAAHPDLPIVVGNACNKEDLAAVDASCSELGWTGVDAVVNCVGLFDFYQGLGDIEEAVLERGFDEVFHVNVLSSLLIGKTFLPRLQDARGTMILTGSSSSFYPGRGGILYISSKFAIRGCVAALAHEFAPDVRVNGVAPGGVRNTDLRGSPALGLSEMRLPDEEARVRDLEVLTPLRTAMGPDDVAQSYVFLASEGARGMTGEFLHPDGGMGIRG